MSKLDTMTDDDLDALIESACDTHETDEMGWLLAGVLGALLLGLAVFFGGVALMRAFGI